MLTRDFMSVADVAKLLSVTETTVRSWIHSGELSAFDLGRAWRIAPKDLEVFLEARRSNVQKE